MLDFFSYRLNKSRTEKGLRQNELADKLSVSQKTISSWESGKTREPNYETVNKIALILNVEPLYFFGDDEETRLRILFELKESGFDVPRTWKFPDDEEEYEKYLKQQLKEQTQKEYLEKIDKIDKEERMNINNLSHDDIDKEIAHCKKIIADSEKQIRFFELLKQDYDKALDFIFPIEKSYQSHLDSLEYQKRMDEAVDNFPEQIKRDILNIKPKPYRKMRYINARGQGSMAD